jgi:hypothetical protein
MELDTFKIRGSRFNQALVLAFSLIVIWLNLYLPTEMKNTSLNTFSIELVIAIVVFFGSAWYGLYFCISKIIEDVIYTYEVSSTSITKTNILNRKVVQYSWEDLKQIHYLDRAKESNLWIFKFALGDSVQISEAGKITFEGILRENEIKEILKYIWATNKGKSILEKSILNLKESNLTSTKITSLKILGIICLLAPILYLTIKNDPILLILGSGFIFIIMAWSVIVDRMRVKDFLEEIRPNELVIKKISKEFHNFTVEALRKFASLAENDRIGDFLLKLYRSANSRSRSYKIFDLEEFFKKTNP